MNPVEGGGLLGVRMQPGGCSPTTSTAFHPPQGPCQASLGSQSLPTGRRHLPPLTPHTACRTVFLKTDLITPLCHFTPPRVPRGFWTKPHPAFPASPHHTPGHTYTPARTRLCAFADAVSCLEGPFLSSPPGKLQLTLQGSFQISLPRLLQLPQAEFQLPPVGSLHILMI